MRRKVLGEEFLLVKVAILIKISLLNEFQYVIIAHDDIEILVEHLLYFSQTHQAFLFSVE